MTLFDQLLVIVLCMLVAGFLSGIETGVVSIHRVQLQHLVRRRDKEAKILQWFLDDSDRLLGTTLSGTNLCIVIISVLSTSMVQNVPGVWAKVLSTLIDTFLLLIFSEYLPKAWFHTKPLERSRMFASSLKLVETLLRPLAASAVWATWLFVRRSAAKSFASATPFLTREDLKMLVTEGEQSGAISSSKRRMIHNVLELSGRTAAQIMIPRDKMTVAYTDTTVREFLETARASHFTRIPVMDRTTNEFAGIVNLFFVVSADPQNVGKTVAGFIRKPLFIPETAPVDNILPIMRRSRQPVCLVVNDGRQVTGMVTSEDIVREIFGKP